MAEPRPNVILITTDQQRGDCLGIEPHPVLQTPNLDYLAHTGTRFCHGYAEAPSCIPARRSLMSGTAPAANGMVGFRGGVEWQPDHTLAGELARAGYQTEMIGKLHLAPVRKRFGFDHMQLADGTRGGGGSDQKETGNDYVDWLRAEHGHHEVHPGMAHGVSSNSSVGRPHHCPEHQMHTFWCINQAMEFLQKRDPSVPCFLNISFIDPHPPFTPPTCYYDRYINRDLPPPVVGDWALPLDGPQKGMNPDAAEGCIDPHAMQCSRAAYYGMINFIDDQIGRLVQFARSLFNESLVIFTSDHGEMLGDHNCFRKCWPYEPSARVPYLIRTPVSWGLPDQVVCRSAVGLQDIMPTILDVAGLAIPDTCTGHSLFPILKGEVDGVRDYLHGEHAGQSGMGPHGDDFANHYLTDGHFKYIWYSNTGREQLFDLDHDPNELTDLALTDSGQPSLLSWREELIGVLKGRPEGFTDGKRLVIGKSIGQLIPTYEPDKLYPFL